MSDAPFIVDNNAAGPCLRIADADCADNVLFVETANAPRLLRDLAEATAKACGWGNPLLAKTLSVGGERFFVCLGRVYCTPPPQGLSASDTRALAVALLIAADEAEAAP